jgi:hypothetical protein
MNFDMPEHSKEAWYNAYIKEISKQKSTSPRVFENSMYTHEGLSFPNVGYDYTQKLGHPPISIMAHLVEPDNLAILRALLHGVRALWLEIKEPQDWELLFKNVYLSFLQTRILASAESVNSLGNFIMANGFTKFDFALLSLDTNHVNPPCTIRKMCRLVNLDKSELVLLMAQLSKDLSDGIINHTLVLNPSLMYFQNIAVLRAIRILFANLAQYYDIPKANLEIAASIDSEVLDVDEAIIKNTIKASSVLIGGADFMSFGFWNNENECRLNHNIGHILDLESKKNMHQDAMAGSYFMEDITSQIVNSIWENLNLNK